MNTVRRSKINRRVSVLMLLVVTSMIALTVLMNFFFLGRYYQSLKEKKLQKAYDTLSEAASENILYRDSYESSFEQLYMNDNLSIIVVSSDGTVLLSSTGENDRMIGRLQDSMFSPSDRSTRQTLVDNENYMLSKDKDPRFNEDYLVLTGTLSDGNIIQIRSAIESIREAAMISNRFLLFAGAIAVIIAAIVGQVVTRMITDPINKMTALSQQMSSLNFDAKYVPTKRHDELDDLGEHLNELSAKLQQSIGKLKTANNDLQRDLENRDKTELMRREFLSNASHELKTPIAVIQGYAEGLQDGIAQSPEDIRFYTDTIIDEAQRMNHLVRQMIDLNKLEYGESTASMERFNLTATIASLIASQKILADQSGIAISFDDSREVYVWADEFLTENVINNYLSNAIHYCIGDKQITVSYAFHDDVVRLSVFNTGAPIPEESLPHIWEKFYKVDKARTREYGGSGIGLSIVKAVADTFHQHCGVMNHENGVEFWFEFDTGNA